MEATAHVISVTEADPNPTNADGNSTWTVNVEVDGNIVHRDLVLHDPFPQVKHNQCRQYLGQLLAELQAVEAKVANADKHLRRKHMEERSKILSDARETSSLIDEYCRNLYQQLNLSTKAFSRPTLQINIHEQHVEHRDTTEHQHPTEDVLQGTRTTHALHWELLEASDLWDASSVLRVVVRRVVSQVSQLAEPSHSLGQPSRSINDTTKTWSGQDQCLNVLLVVARDLSEQPRILDPSQSSRSNPMQDTDPSLAQLAILSVQKKRQLLKRAHQVRLTIARPGTFIALQETLEQASKTYGKGYYSIIHLDVHGMVSETGSSEIDPGHAAFLQFANDESEEIEHRSAFEVAQLIKCHEISCAVINACASAAASEGVNANLSRVFVQAGVSNVVAMSDQFSSYASDIFQSSFYDAFLSQNQTFSGAAAIARGDLRNNRLRPRGKREGTKIQDWFVPVVYTNGKEISVVLSDRRGPRLSWPCQLPAPITRGSKGMLATTRHIWSLRYHCSALQQICRVAFNQSVREGLRKLPILITRSIADELNLLALDIDTLKLEKSLIDDRLVVLHGIADDVRMLSLKLRRMTRLWLMTGFMGDRGDVHYIEARQFLEESPRLSERLRQQDPAHDREVAEIYPLTPPEDNEDHAARPRVVLVIDRLDELFTTAKSDQWHRQGQQRLIKFLHDLPRRNPTTGRYPCDMPYVILVGNNEDPEWWRQALDDAALDITFRQCHQTAIYRRFI